MCRMMIIRLVLETMGPERSLECFPIDFGQFLDILRLFEKKFILTLGQFSYYSLLLWYEGN